MSLSLEGKRGEPPFFNFCFFSSHFCNDLNDGAKPSQPVLCNPSTRYAVDDYPLDFDFLVGRCNPRAEIALMRAPASFPLFQSSRKIRRTNCLFSEDISPAPLAEDCITAEQRWEACSWLDGMDTQDAAE